ncbi:hypothetical protein D3C76_1405090 [compost metagenome]
MPHSTRRDGENRIDESRRIEDGYVKKDIILTSKGDGTPRKYHERVKLYPLETFKQLIAAAGLQLESVHGSYDEEEYDEEHSKRMIFVGVRP